MTNEEANEIHLARTIQNEIQIEVLLDMLFSYVSNGDEEQKSYIKKDYQVRLKNHLENNLSENHKALLKKYLQ